MLRLKGHFSYVKFSILDFICEQTPSNLLHVQSIYQLDFCFISLHS